MSENRVVLVEHPARLSVDLGRIRIERADQKDVFVLPSDIAILLLHHHTVELTSQVLRKLSDHRAIVLVTDERHLPSAWLVPMYGLPMATLRLRQQLQLNAETRKRL